MSSDQPSGRHQELLLKHLLERIARQMTRVDREVDQLRTSLNKLAEVSPHIAEILDQAHVGEARVADQETPGTDEGSEPAKSGRRAHPMHHVDKSAKSPLQPSGRAVESGKHRQQSAEHLDVVHHVDDDVAEGAAQACDQPGHSADTGAGQQTPPSPDAVDVSKADLPKPRPAVARRGSSQPTTEDAACPQADLEPTDAETVDAEVCLEESTTQTFASTDNVDSDSLDSDDASPGQVSEVVQQTVNAEPASNTEPEPLTGKAPVRPVKPAVAEGKASHGGDTGNESEWDLASMPPPADPATPVSGDILERQPEWADDVADKTEQTAESASRAASAATADAAAAVAAVAAIHPDGSERGGGEVQPGQPLTADGQNKHEVSATDDVPRESKHQGESNYQGEPARQNEPVHQSENGNATEVGTSSEPEALSGQEQVQMVEQAVSSPDEPLADDTPSRPELAASRTESAPAPEVTETTAQSPEEPRSAASQNATSEQNSGTNEQPSDRESSTDGVPQDLNVPVHATKAPSVRSVFDPVADHVDELEVVNRRSGELPRRSDHRRSYTQPPSSETAPDVDIAKVIPPQMPESTEDVQDGQEPRLKVPQPREEVFNAGTRHWTHGALHNWSEAGRQSVVSVPEGIGIKGLCLLAMCDAADHGRAVTIVVQTHREAVAWEHFLRHDAAAAVPATRTLPAEIELCAVGSNAVPAPDGPAADRLWIGVGMDRWTGNLSVVEELIRSGAWVLGTIDDGDGDQTKLDAIGLGSPAYRLSREQALELRLFGSYRIALVPVPLYRTEANRYQATTSKVADTTRTLSSLVGSTDVSVLYRAARSWSADSVTGRQGTAARAWLQARQQQVESLADVGSKLAAVSAVLSSMKDVGQASILTRWSASSVKVATDLRKAGRKPCVSREKDRAESAEAWRAFTARESDVFVSADVPHGHLVVPKAKTLLLTSGPVSVQQAVRRLSGVATGGTLAIMFAPGTVEDPSEDPYQCLTPLMNNATSLHQVQPTASRRH